MIQLPDDVIQLIKQLNRAGFEAYAVGGCVRDSLLGVSPEDWDICTSALPEEMKECFSGYKVLETGIKHGTLTIRLNHHSYEITSFRKDGEYTDCRHPDRVEFVSEIKEDLARRDFTINAMAYHPDTGIVDYYDGQNDLKNGVIRCVGEAAVRFSEDALRIMRGLRFAAVYGFSIEADTKAAMLSKKELLNKIAAERIQVELKKLLLGEHAEEILLQHSEIISIIIPEMIPMIGFDQKNPHHCYDIWTHTVKSLGFSEKNLVIRLAVLFHDIGKPKTFFADENGIGHFYSHAEMGEKICNAVLHRLKFDTKTIQAVSLLVRYHDVQIQPTEKSVKKWLHRIGPEQFEHLLSVKKADAKSTVNAEDKLKMIDNIQSVYRTVLEQNACFSLKDLTVNGRDLILLGIKEGKEIGTLLSELLELVMENQLKNDRKTLLTYLKKRIKK